MASVTPTLTPLRSLFDQSAEEVLVFATDLTSEPPGPAAWFRVNPMAHLKSSRALPLAEDRDIVVLPGPLYHPYYEWLRQHQFGPSTVVAYGLKNPELSLADIIVHNPDPLVKAIRATGKRALYIPFFANHSDHAAAAAVGAELFGCDPSITTRLHDKESFTEIIRALQVPAVEGGVRSRVPSSSIGSSAAAFERILSALLKNYSRLIVRGAIGSAGSSVYSVESVNMAEVLQQLQQHAGSNVLIEPFKKIIASPNDQWGVARHGGIHHIGTSTQLFSGLKHAGNVYGQYFAPRIIDSIETTSKTIMQYVASMGYRGVAGLDYIVCDEGIFPIENNARLNGSSFAFGIYDRIHARIPSVRCWKFFKAATEPCEFESLYHRCGSLLYNNTRVNSVFPFDCDLLSTQGLFTALLVAEDMHHIEYLENSLLELGVRRV